MSIQINYTEVTKFGGSHTNNIIMDTFATLLSSKNHIFHNFIQPKKDDWEYGLDISLDERSDYAVTKYNSMVEQRM